MLAIRNCILGQCLAVRVTLSSKWKDDEENFSPFFLVETWERYFSLQLIPFVAFDTDKIRLAWNFWKYYFSLEISWLPCTIASTAGTYQCSACGVVDDSELAMGSERSLTVWETPELTGRLTDWFRRTAVGIDHTPLHETPMMTRFHWQIQTTSTAARQWSVILTASKGFSNGNRRQQWWPRGDREG